MKHNEHINGITCGWLLHKSEVLLPYVDCVVYIVQTTVLGSIVPVVYFYGLTGSAKSCLVFLGSARVLVYMQFSNKLDFSFCAFWDGFANPVTYKAAVPY